MCGSSISSSSKCQKEEVSHVPLLPKHLKGLTEAIKSRCSISQKRERQAEFKVNGNVRPDATVRMGGGGGRRLLMLGQGWPVHSGMVEGTVVLVSAAAFHGEVATYGTL